MCIYLDLPSFSDFEPRIHVIKSTLSARQYTIPVISGMYVSTTSTRATRPELGSLLANMPLDPLYVL
jgi:hypothetical protein